ncbi:MAG: hypothetical protein F6J89_33115 [Symploca sp. SIO1C4]|uniref:Uncharacterized protein n=1 Tax=Symploca sp. SIO1C4 TaxID=2607765 RepID=A0A6B3NPS5_9CYAN|nr:hypothetical protein [Symploca sp. SIO1C4]
MEDFVLATFLFFVYFSFISWLFDLHQPQTASDAPASNTTTATPEPEVIETQSPPGRSEVTEPAAVSSRSEAELTPQPEHSLEELLQGINLDKLQLRPARKIASRIGVRQKVNGKDQPLAWLRAQIKKRLAEKPLEVAPVIAEVLSAA